MMSAFDKAKGGATRPDDSKVDLAISEALNQFGVSTVDALKLFPVFSRRVWLKRFLAHHMLFQETLNVPGDIAELGVFRGAGLFTWANFLEIFCIGDRTKVVWGFDNWSGFQTLGSEDGSEDTDAGKTQGGFDAACFRPELDQFIEIFDTDRFVSWKPRIKLIEGDIVDTAPKFVAENPGVRFSLIHFDCDLYAPTKAALEAFWDKLSRGGIMLFDEYAIQTWPGETQAVDEFIQDKAHLKIETLPWTNVPAGILRKP